MSSRDTLDQLADLGIKFTGGEDVTTRDTGRTSTPPAPGLREACTHAAVQCDPTRGVIRCLKCGQSAALRAESVAAPAGWYSYDTEGQYLLFRHSDDRSEVVAEKVPDEWVSPMLALLNRRAASPPALDAAHCPAAKHHRVKRFHTGTAQFVEEHGELGLIHDRTLESDTCVACGFDFAGAATPASGEPAAPGEEKP